MLIKLRNKKEKLVLILQNKFKKSVFGFIFLLVSLLFFLPVSTQAGFFDGISINHQSEIPKNEKELDELTQSEIVIRYLKTHKTLPSYYITKREANKKGWIAHDGNLCKVADFKAIGGDPFYNRENKLPKKKSRKWFEADLNYNCGRRGADRLIYSNDGLIYVTNDHYKTFQSKGNWK